MRPPRLILLLLCFVALPTLLTIFSLFTSPSQSTTTDASSRSSRFRALFSFHSPTSLFPPSAIISLTDDNSTFFLARPAAFGPMLPSKGLSGQLWVGSGFGDDSLRKGGVATGSEGELGCSDVPGWGEGKVVKDEKAKDSTSRKTLAKPAVDMDAAGQKSSKPARAVIQGESLTGASTPRVKTTSEDDGTDDYLHQHLPGSDKLATTGQLADPATSGKQPTHADIQSLQESAEIAGKVVLLSRGGCGFLEKVKWVQRRGGRALIVGDNTRGGGLVTMYAHGDTSNVTIPALFTSHTTAHLLSSLIPSNGEDLDEALANGKSPSRISSSKSGDSRASLTIDDKSSKTVSDSVKSNSPSADGADGRGSGRGWFQSLLSTFGFGSGRNDGLEGDSRRPPTSGNIDWVLLEDWDEDDKDTSKSSSTSSSKTDTSAKQDSKKTDKTSSGGSSKSASGDGFEIGVQDWRDPDLVTPGDSKTDIKPSKVKSKAKPTSQPAKDGVLKGGSITPSSGEYVDPASAKADSKSGKKTTNSNTQSSSKADSNSDDDSWWFFGFGSHDDDVADTTKSTPSKDSKDKNSKIASSANDLLSVLGENAADGHEGLWVTLTPTNMSSSPFFDTLLVLVVSPLVTLTVVYALLLLRSRIRRRRWRAPKSVVDRLPVRTYHTIASTATSTSNSSLHTSPATSSPSSPLLRSNPRPTTLSRQRSQTTCGLPTSDPNLSRSQQEKASSAQSVWRRRYTGRQLECVVCLEEYVDGQSQVMSLPCGHEFHAECITPWLTTRRRTCPICKGDVVRSMAANSGQSSDQNNNLGGSTSDDIQAQAGETANESPSSALPIATFPEEDDSDLERGLDDEMGLLSQTPSRSPPRGSGWRNLANLGLSLFGRDNSRAENVGDRSR